MTHSIHTAPHDDQDAKPHRCAKCLEPMPAPDFVVNKSMAYCEDCARILHLGESKESRMFSDLHDPDLAGPPPAAQNPDVLDIPVEPV